MGLFSSASSFYWWENWCIEKLKNLLNVGDNYVVAGSGQGTGSPNGLSSVFVFSIICTDCQGYWDSIIHLFAQASTEWLLCGECYDKC